MTPIYFANRPKCVKLAVAIGKLAPWAAEIGNPTQMLTFRASITFAVMAFVVALTALLIAIQVRSLRFATNEAASAYMDAASTKALGRLQGELSRDFIPGECARDQFERGRFG